jgi:uracil-DNA glycosylase
MQSWKEIIEAEKSKEYYQKLKSEIDHRYETSSVYPPKDKIFAAFGKTPTELLKVVILGQDPYHGEGQAQGLAFSTPSSIKNPPSMVNILKEIESDLNVISICSDGELTPWANQGVLLLNTILTVQANQAKSHHNLGWEIFTDNIITHISNNFENIIFLLWGSNAISKTKLIDTTRHHILSAPHPSPLSAYRGFFGCAHFSQTNEILKRIGKEPIVW